VTARFCESRSGFFCACTFLLAARRRFKQQLTGGIQVR